jgi:hypothetical protein
MSTLFKCAQRCELVEANPMQLVRVKDVSKRLERPPCSRRRSSISCCCTLAAVPKHGFEAEKLFINGSLGRASGPRIEGADRSLNHCCDERTLMAARPTTRPARSNAKTIRGKGFDSDLTDCYF